MKKFLIILLPFFMASNCSEVKTPQEHQLTVKGGQKFNIELPANLTTGYQWTVCNYTPASGIILKKYKYKIDKGAGKDKKFVGGPGKEIFSFKAEDVANEVTIKLFFNKIRPWENEPAETVDYSIKLLPEAESDND